MSDMAQFTNTIIGKAPKRRVIAPSIAVSPNTVAWAESAGHANSSTLFFYDLSLKIDRLNHSRLEAPVKELEWITAAFWASSRKTARSISMTQTNKICVRSLTTCGAKRHGGRLADRDAGSKQLGNIHPERSERILSFQSSGYKRAQTSFWYHDNDHLFIAYPDHVSFLDLEDASLANFATVSSGTAATTIRRRTRFSIDPRGDCSASISRNSVYVFPCFISSLIFAT